MNTESSRTPTKQFHLKLPQAILDSTFDKSCRLTSSRKIWITSLQLAQRFRVAVRAPAIMVAAKMPRTTTRATDVPRMPRRPALPVLAGAGTAALEAAGVCVGATVVVGRAGVAEVAGVWVGADVGVAVAVAFGAAGVADGV